MKKTGLVVAAVSALMISSSVASAAVPFGLDKVATNVQKVIFGTENYEQTSSLARSCNDSRYRWYEYSAIEAITCIVSGKW